MFVALAAEAAADATEQAKKLIKLGVFCLALSLINMSDLTAHLFIYVVYILDLGLELWSESELRFFSFCSRDAREVIIHVHE